MDISANEAGTIIVWGGIKSSSELSRKAAIFGVVLCRLKVSPLDHPHI
jgi:hypothetical protein